MLKSLNGINVKPAVAIFLCFSLSIPIYAKSESRDKKSSDVSSYSSWSTGAILAGVAATIGGAVLLLKKCWEPRQVPKGQPKKLLKLKLNPDDLLNANRKAFFGHGDSVNSAIFRDVAEINSIAQLIDKLKKFTKSAHQAMETESKDPKRFCLRRARLFQKAWNLSNPDTMQVVYVLQRENGQDTAPLLGPASLAWAYHVAAVYNLGTQTEPNYWVLDPVFEEGGLPFEEWKTRLGINSRHRIFIAKPENDYDVAFTQDGPFVKPTRLQGRQ